MHLRLPGGIYRLQLRIFAASTLLLVLTLTARALPQASATEAPRKTSALAITVLDENGVAVRGAHVQLEHQGELKRCETDPAGHCEFRNVGLGATRLRVEKEGFYVFTLPTVQASGTLEIVLTHQQEVRESVNVVESPPALDPARSVSEEQLSGIDILNIPYPNTRDYRYALEYIPGVVLDQNAQPHLAGSETYQTLVVLDGFNVTQPANGALLVRPSTDALRAVRAETSRIPAQYGKASGGVLAIETGIGDDHYRFAATNFVPSLQNKKGWTFDKVDPRFTVSGPLKRGKAWFFDGLDGEYDHLIIPDLPPHQDSDIFWRAGNLAKVQFNPGLHDIVSTSFLSSWQADEHLGFSTLAPPLTRPRDSENAFIASLKEQHMFTGEKLLEFGLGYDQYGLRQVPLGSASYVLTPTGAEGNYYLHARTRAERRQAIANFYFPRRWHGRHDLLVGTDLDRLIYGQFFERSPISSVHSAQNLAPGETCHGLPAGCTLYSAFFGGKPGTIYNAEASAYLEDHWALLPRLMIAPGLRFDWDEIVRRPLVSPRVAATYMLDNQTKLSAGAGVYYEATNLSLIAAPFAGEREDTFATPSGPKTFLTSFTVDRSRLRAPQYFNWSVELERKLPAAIFLKTEFLERRGHDGFVYNRPGGTRPTSFLLENTRRDHYFAFKVDLRRSFHKGYLVSVSYTHSRARSNEVLDYSLDNLLISPQVPGLYPWDVPNRLLSWGILPLKKGFDLGYSLETRTGFTFPTVNEQQQLVEPPGIHRFLEYFTLNLHLEKRFHALGSNWALRGGFDNLTNRQNAYVVNNIVGSPQFLRFSAFDRRAFTARIRFLGKK
jgi:hypothetical protein